jgi:hypothetical protein
MHTQVAEALSSLSIPFGSFDILEDEAVRQVGVPTSTKLLSLHALLCSMAGEGLSKCRRFEGSQCYVICVCAASRCL